MDSRPYNLNKLYQKELWQKDILVIFCDFFSDFM